MSGLNEANIWHLNTLSTTHVPAILIFIYILHILNKVLYYRLFFKQNKG